MQLEETAPQPLSTITDPEELPLDAAQRPDWNCLKDYGITDAEYAAMGEQDADEDEDMER
jgi:hypothetical protein